MAELERIRRRHRTETRSPALGTQFFEPVTLPPVASRVLG